MDSSAIFAKGDKDIPEWMKSRHDWQAAQDVTKLQKLELQMKLCCPSCEEKVVEEMMEVQGVFDVKVDKPNERVTVVATPGAGPDHKEVLKKAKKIDKKAKFVSEPDQKGKGKGGKKEGGAEAEADGSTSDSTTYHTSAVIAPSFFTTVTSEGVAMFPMPMNFDPITNFQYLHRRTYCNQCVNYTSTYCANCFGQGRV